MSWPQSETTWLEKLSLERGNASVAVSAVYRAGIHYAGKGGLGQFSATYL